MVNKVKQINESLKNGKLIIAFMMVGCHWCDELKPIWNSVKSKYPGELFDIAVSQEDPNILDKLDCDTKDTTKGFPCICAYNNGKKIECFNVLRKLFGVVLMAIAVKIFSANVQNLF